MYNYNNTDTNDNVYGAVIVTQVTLRVHPVHLMYAAQRQTAADPQTRPTNLGCESALGCYMAYIRHRHFIIARQHTAADARY